MVMSSTKTGDLIYNSRVLKKMRINELAGLTGVSKSMISLIETGKQTSKKAIFLKKVCSVLNINEDEMKNAVVCDFTDKLLKEWESE